MTRARSFLTYAASFVAIALVLGVCMGAWALTRPGSPSGSPGGTAAASESQRPSAASSVAPDDLRVFAIGPIPAEHRFVFAGENGKERLMLVDADHSVVIEAARFQGLGSFIDGGRGGDISATADGKTVVIMLEGRNDARVYLIHPENGGVTSFKIGPADTPRLSPDAKQLAYSRTVGDSARDGVWLMDTASGSEKRVIVTPGSKPPKPATWSSDGRYLVLTGIGGDTIGLFDTQSSSTKTVAPGSGARWRGGELYYWSGPRLSSYDPATGATRVVYQTGGATIVRAELKPSANDIATIEQQGTDAVVWLRNAGVDRALRGGGNVIAMWWSADGKKLYVWDSVEATTMVSDAFTGTPSVKFCLRGEISPPCS